MTKFLSCAAAAIAIACRAEPATEGPHVMASAISAASPDKPSASVELDRLDSRAPVPLLPMMANHQKANMRDHLLAVQEIVAAAAASDFPGVEKAARRIGYSEQMGQMCTHMGAAAPGFTERALAFHHSADAIAASAREHDAPAVLRALSATLTSCTGCHAQFKQQIVAELPH